ncbi:hypothetical protein [Fodinicola feengrottensis]|uniref:hypothetical protein n=1 Tax=Fodinicola feengrottensis TaxID=435914 RepID=UPI0013D6BEB8|nr:hypothetical protein [Fodinicola feengrottensis]
MSEPVIGYHKSPKIPKVRARKPSFWPRVARGGQITGTAVTAGARKAWFDLVGTVTSLGIAGVGAYVLNSSHLPAGVKAVATFVLGGSVTAKAGASFWSETGKTTADERAKDSPQTARAGADEPRIAALEQRAASLEAANAQLRLNNAAVLADYANMRASRTPPCSSPIMRFVRKMSSSSTKSRS